MRGIVCGVFLGCVSSRVLSEEPIKGARGAEAAVWLDDDDDVALLQTMQKVVTDRHVEATNTTSNITFDVLHPTFYINLDLPPDQRWEQVRNHFMPVNPGPTPMTIAWINWVDTVLTPAEKQAWVSALQAVVPQEYQQEIAYGVNFEQANGLSPANLTFQQLVEYDLLTLAIYELNYPSLFCSGNLVAMPNGTVIHGRNLDYSMAGGNLAANVYTAVFTQGGLPLYTAPMFGGTIGLHTAMRYGGWSFEQNTHPANGNPGSRSLNLQVLQQGGQVYSTFLRDLMKSTATFQAAQATIQATKFMAPSFFIMAGAGPYEGVIITADRQVSTDAGFPTPYNSVNVLSPVINRWYFVQTNDEFWGPPEDNRRDGEIAHLEQLGQQNATLDTVLAVMRIPPAYNSMTVFTWSAVPASGAQKLAAFGENVPCILGTVNDPGGSGGCFGPEGSTR